MAAEIGETLAARSAELSRKLQRRTLDIAPRAKVTWVPADRLHLTVRFIGEVNDDRASAVCRTLEPALAVPSFDLTLAGAGTFPKGGAPRVLWIGIGSGRHELVAAEHEISARLSPLGIPTEERHYNPHLTLARVREPAGLRSSGLLDGLADTVVGTVHIDAITLFQSKLSPKGPTCTPLLRIALGGSKDPPLR